METNFRSHHKWVIYIHTWNSRTADHPLEVLQNGAGIWAAMIHDHMGMVRVVARVVVKWFIIHLSALVLSASHRLLLILDGLDQASARCFHRCACSP